MVVPFSFHWRVQVGDFGACRRACVADCGTYGVNNDALSSVDTGQTDMAQTSFLSTQLWNGGSLACDLTSGGRGITAKGAVASAFPLSFATRSLAPRRLGHQFGNGERLIGGCCLCATTARQSVRLLVERSAITRQLRQVCVAVLHYEFFVAQSRSAHFEVTCFHERRS